MTRFNPVSVAQSRRMADTTAEAQLMHNALASLHQACSTAAAKMAGARLVHNSEMCLSFAAGLPETAIVLNHGFVTTDADRIAEAAALYRQAGIPRFFLSCDGVPDQKTLDRAGLHPARSWRIFRRDATAKLPVLARTVPVSEVQSGGACDFARIASAAFDLGDAARAWLEGLPEVPGWHVFQANLDGKPAGTGALYIWNGYAWTDFGATRPACRSRGVQKALLAHRIQFARSLGCHTILSCTGEAVPGEAQISYRNILSLGFEEAEIMHNFT